MGKKTTVKRGKGEKREEIKNKLRGHGHKIVYTTKYLEVLDSGMNIFLAIAMLVMGKNKFRS